MLKRLYGEETEWKPNGKLTQMYFWDRSLTDTEMKHFSKSCQYRINKTGKYHNLLIDLRLVKMHREQNVSFREASQ